MRTDSKLKIFLRHIGEELEYRCWIVPRDFANRIKRYVKNRILFDKLIRTWRPWDYSFQVELFTFGIEQLRNYIENKGNEEDFSRMKKVMAMDALLKEIKRNVFDEAFNSVYGEDWLTRGLDNDDKKRRKFNRLRDKMRHEHYKDIARILEGQNSEELSKKVDENISKFIHDDSIPEEEKIHAQREGYYKQFAEAFDGTGIEGWWD